MRKFLALMAVAFLPWTQAAAAARCRYGWHDWPDDRDAYAPLHFEIYRCVRCDKEFSI